MMDLDSETLRAEVAYFHRRLFGAPVPQAVSDQYVLAHSHVNPEAGAPRVNVSAIVERDLDVEAIEWYLRLRLGPNPLTRKLQILFYLVEVRPAYYRLFAETRPSWFKALARLAGALFSSAVKWLIGFFQVRGNGIA